MAANADPTNVTWKVVAGAAVAFALALYWRAEDREDKTIQTMSETQQQLVVVQRGLLEWTERHEDDYSDLSAQLQGAIRNFERKQ